MTRFAPRFLCLVVVCLPLAVGCGGPSDEPPREEAATHVIPGVTSDEPLLEPFDPPPLDELEAEVTWVDHEPVDALALFKEYMATKPELATVEEALSLRNTSSEANAKILSALGRPPASDDDIDWDASINRHLRGEVKSTNPLMISSTQEFSVSGLTSFGFFGFDWDMTPFAAKDTVVSWQTSEDSMYDKVVMRDDLTWSDGTPITAHDVEFSFQVIMNPKVPIPAVRSGTDRLRWVEAYDDQTIVYFHKEPLATNVWNINFPIIPKHIYEKSIEEDPTLQNSRYHVQQESDPVVGGAYRIASRARGQEIVLERREDYYMHDGKQVRDRPYFKQIRFRVIEDNNTALLAIKSGEIDDLELTAEQWMTQTEGSDFYSNNTKASGAEWVYFYFGWNNQIPLFDDARVRKAMSFAFDHKEMLETLNYGLYEPCNGIFHSNSWMAPEDPAPPYTQDLDQAEKLLDEAGWTDHDGDGIRDKEIGGRLVPFEFSLLVSNVPERIKLCNLLKENLDSIGIICHIRPLESTVLQQRMLNREFQACFAGWGTGADPDTAENVWATEEGRNYVGYSNEEVDRLFEEGRREFDREKRGRIYARIHELIYEDQPYTFLYYQSSFYGFNKQLRGYMFSPRGPFHYSPGFSAFWKPVQ